MKILIISTKMPYPPKDGGAIATFNLANGFSQLNNEVTILTINTSKHYFDIRNIPENISLKINFMDFYINTDIKPIAALINLIFSKKPYNAQRFISKGFEQKISDLLKTEKFDIIQLEGLYLCFYINIIRQNSKAKIVFRAHNVEHEIWERTVLQEKSFFKKKYLNILAKRIKRLEFKSLNNYDLLVPITKRDGLKLNEMGNSKPMFVSSTGYDLSNLQNNKKTEIEYPSLFHIGALDWSPNQEGIIWFLDNCWNKIIEKLPNLKFYIAGRNAPDWFVKKISLQNIIFCGEIDNASDFINSKALMLVPLLSGSGMRIKVIEGMALGKTIISTSIGVEGIDIEQNKNILIANTPNDFVLQITNIFEDKKHFFEIGEKAKFYISENFDNLALSKKLLDFYLTINKQL